MRGPRLSFGGGSARGAGALRDERTADGGGHLRGRFHPSKRMGSDPLFLPRVDGSRRAALRRPSAVTRARTQIAPRRHRTITVDASRGPLRASCAGCDYRL
jgi:hypothetical protein